LNYKFIVCPPGGQLVLQDIDITSKTETNSMRRLNTLAHYGVKDKVMVSLVPKQIDSPSHHIYQVRGFEPASWSFLILTSIVQYFERCGL
jgi:hypothetical protein